MSKRKHIRPLVALAAMLVVLGTFVLEGVPAGIACFAALATIIGTCIYAVSGEKVNDGLPPVGLP